MLGSNADEIEKVAQKYAKESGAKKWIPVSAKKNYNVNYLFVSIGMAYFFTALHNLFPTYLIHLLAYSEGTDGGEAKRETEKATHATVEGLDDQKATEGQVYARDWRLQALAA